MFCEDAFLKVPVWNRRMAVTDENRWQDQLGANPKTQRWEISLRLGLNQDSKESSSTPFFQDNKDQL